MQPSFDQSLDRRVTVVEAAVTLGITPDAVRSRLRRGTLRRDEAPDGTVLVVLDDDASGDQPTGRATDQTRVDHISALRSENGLLRQQLEVWQEEARRKDTIIMNMTEAMKALNPPTDTPPEPPDTRVSGTEEPEASSDTERRSWWRRMFGG